MKNKIKTLRTIGIAEGISFLALLFVAMPMKYFLGIPEMVKIVGWIHGALFMLFVTTVIVVQITMRWSFLFFAGALAASVIPFGTFVLDKHLREKETALANQK